MQKCHPLFALLLIVLPGCGTLFFHNPQKVRVTSNVPGSLVIAKDEAILGRIDGLSAEFPLDRRKDHTLLVSAHGNEAATVQVVSHYSWWRILISVSGDVFLGLIPAPPILWGVVALLPDIGSGAWRVLDDDVSVSLRPRAEPPPVASDDLPSTERPASAPVPGAVAAPASPAACPTCGTTAEVDARFCGQCGASLEKRGPAKPCPICGEPRSVAAATCPHCGLK